MRGHHGNLGQGIVVEEGQGQGEAVDGRPHVGGVVDGVERGRRGGVHGGGQHGCGNGAARRLVLQEAVVVVDGDGHVRARQVQVDAVGVGVVAVLLAGPPPAGLGDVDVPQLTAAFPPRPHGVRPHAAAPCRRGRGGFRLTVARGRGGGGGGGGGGGFWRPPALVLGRPFRSLGLPFVVRALQRGVMLRFVVAAASVPAPAVPVRSLGGSGVQGAPLVLVDLVGVPRGEALRALGGGAVVAVDGVPCGVLCQSLELIGGELEPCTLLHYLAVRV